MSKQFPRAAYRRRRGLTLVEVVVAMTLLAVGILGVVGAVAACVRGHEAAAGYSRGALLAQQVAAELERNETLDADTLEGTFDDVSTDYSWTADVSAADDRGLHPVHITVQWHKGTRQYEVDTLIRPHALPAPVEDTGGTATGGDA